MRDAILVGMTNVTQMDHEQMIAAARKHKRAVQMGVQRRRTPGVMEAVTKLHAGVVGNGYCARRLVQQQPGVAGDRQTDHSADDA